MTGLVERPGAVNAHTHLYSGLVPLGMPAPFPRPATFLEILRHVWWRLDRSLDAEALRAAARYYVAHALLAGTTTIVDHHESPNFIGSSLDVIASACDELGARAVLCYGATERNFGREEACAGLAECQRFIESRREGRVRGAIGLHASFTVSDATLLEAGDMARALGVPVHVHVAEDRADVDDARARGHDSPLSRLLAYGALPIGSILAHGVHLTESEVCNSEALVLWLVHNPRSNANNRVGYAGALTASSRVALGTDGFPADMEEELMIARDEATAHGDVLAAVEARLGTGRALAAEIFGEEAIRSDRVWIDEHHERRSGSVPPARGSVPPAHESGGFRSLRESGSHVPERRSGTTEVAVRPHPRVVHVEVDGEPVVRDGALVRASLAEIESDARRAAERLWKRMEEIPS